MSEIDFETGRPIFQVEFYHNTPETPGYWTRALNADSEEDAIQKSVELFRQEGLNPARIVSIRTWPLVYVGEVTFDGGRETSGMADFEVEDS